MVKDRSERTLLAIVKPSYPQTPWRDNPIKP
jgi:hypothetical protein